MTEGELKNKMMFYLGGHLIDSGEWSEDYMEEQFNIVLRDAKTEFNEALIDLPFPTKERNDKLVELIKKWFGDFY